MFEKLQLCVCVWAVFGVVGGRARFESVVVKLSPFSFCISKLALQSRIPQCTHLALQH